MSLPYCRKMAEEMIMKKFSVIKDKLFLIKTKDIVSLIILIVAVPYAFCLRMLQKKIWLVCERKDEARDNGYAFFKYAIEKTEVDVYYAIDKKSNDYKKLSGYEKKIISFGSVRHMAYYLACDAIVSSVKNCGPNDLIGFLFRSLHLMNKKIFFIQHGITKDSNEWLHYKKTKFRAITCGAYPEYEFIKQSFGYPDDSVLFTGGMCRYDYLHNIENRIQNYVLIMPTWRKWLKRGDPQFKEIEHTNVFSETRYYKKWNSLIYNDDMLTILKKNNLKVVFYPHPTMQHYITDFERKNNNVIIANWQEWDLQKLIRNAAMLITDYSSVFFDFIYMKKPIIFYQFDIKDFRKFHYPKGYFHYNDNPFSVALYSLKNVIERIETIINQNYTVNEEYLKEHKKYFPLYDNHNTERTFTAIYKIVYEEECT